jgi:glutamyl-tRNA synthetase
MREADDTRLFNLIWPGVHKMLDGKVADNAQHRIQSGMSDLKERAKNTLELTENAAFYARIRPLKMNEKAAKLISGDGHDVLRNVRTVLADITNWETDVLKEAAKGFAEQAELKLGNVAQPLRASLTGSNVSPGIFEVMEVLGKEECLGRLDDALRGA